MQFRKIAAMGAFALMLAGPAFAQLNPPASNPGKVTQTDLVPIVPGGAPSAAQPFVNPGQIGAMLNEQDAVPVTGFSITPLNTTSLLFLNPATTPLATGTVTMPANPGSGQEFCLLDSGVVTTLTVSANTGQSLVGTAVAATVAGTSYCWRYISLTSTWYRLQ